MNRKRITILGATGSIGKSALDIVARHPERYRVVGLAAGRDDAALAELALRFAPEQVALGDAAAAERLARRLGNKGPRVLGGAAGVSVLAAAPADLVICGIVGAAGLMSTFAAVEAGNAIALANKESMVSAGALLVAAAQASGARIFPIDSEHSAIFQCLEAGRREDLDHIVLTASGGPFRATPLEALRHVTPEQAARHPNWDMGAKVTVDSATMMNKGLEVIEARWLFDLTPERIRVRVHPQSIVHSMVAFRDGSVIAQMGTPDMRPPIAYAMSYPERLPTGVAAPDFAKLGPLTFEEPDTTRFPCLELAFAATRACGTLPCVLNAANEVAVAAFLAGRIGFMQIPETVARTMAAHTVRPLTDLAGVLEADAWARAHAARLIGEQPARMGAG
ncbi:MAG: 1-deoxy-D-xylulose-5-phosphate reductoisomerase [Nitrospirae bacterium]|nr:1-deoxy-D-xylulose-5-phosphate reductoisomerase [Nitrospirota bacterium]